jgi:pimeloyl-ACP methyl ester carboxylesterase
MWLNENRGTEPMKTILIALAFLGLAGCFTIGDAQKPIVFETIAAPAPAAERTAIIVLPGFGADAEEMKERGVAKSIHEVWPEADVILASATFDYYRQGRLVERLHEEVIGPAVKAGYKRIWLAGASLGGMGALLYEQQHPQAVTGIVLFAPFLGDRSLLKEISDAGGPRAWQPGELPGRSEFGEIPAPGLEDGQGLGRGTAARAPRLARVRRRGPAHQRLAPDGDRPAAGPFRRIAGRPYLGHVAQRRKNRVFENQERIMKLATFQTNKGASYGIVDGNSVTISAPGWSEATLTC